MTHPNERPDPPVPPSDGSGAALPAAQPEEQQEPPAPQPGLQPGETSSAAPADEKAGAGEPAEPATQRPDGTVPTGSGVPADNGPDPEPVTAWPPDPASAWSGDAQPEPATPARAVPPTAPAMPTSDPAATAVATAGPRSPQVPSRQPAVSTGSQPAAAEFTGEQAGDPDRDTGHHDDAGRPLPAPVDAPSERPSPADRVEGSDQGTVPPEAAVAPRLGAVGPSDAPASAAGSQGVTAGTSSGGHSASEGDEAGAGQPAPTGTAAPAESHPPAPQPPDGAPAPEESAPSGSEPPVPVEPVPAGVGPPAEPAAAEPDTAEPAAAEPATFEPDTVAPATAEPAEPEPATVAPATAEPESAEQAPAGPEPAATPAAGGSSRPSALRGLAPAVVLALLTVLVVLTGYLGWQLYRDNQIATARQQGTLAARDAARLLFSYDYNRLDQDFAAGLAVTTGPFRDQYQKTTSTVVKPVAQQYQAVVKAEVREAGVVQASPDRVVVVVFVNQTTTSTRVTGPRVDQSRVRMTLKNQGGKWLVEQVDAL